MPYRRNRRSLLQRTSQAIKTSKSTVLTHGPGSAPSAVQALITDVGARTTTGSTQQIRDSMSTEEDVNVGSIVKYINFTIESCVRPVEGVGDATIGWIEWAFVCVKETETVMPITNLGTQTLQDVAIKMYRNECVFTGVMPISTAVPNVQQFMLKIPKRKQRIQIGDKWILYLYGRDVSSAQTGTDNFRTWVTQNMKVYV